MTTPAQKPGRSKQDYGTPADFLAAVKVKLGIDKFVFDFACTPENAKAAHYYAGDSLSQDWSALTLEHGWSWLNPPFDRIAPWAQRCAAFKQHGGHVALLVPAAVGSNWFRDHVAGRAYVLFLNGRLTFEGCDQPYPKDCILCLYSPYYGAGYDVWTWKEDKAADAVARAAGRVTGGPRACTSSYSLESA